jgi:hypothetical protein
MAALQYRAFLSYSHADAAWAKWLHRVLENYRIDKDLVGRETALGPVPKTLRPVFRDRDDFSAGHSLADQTVKALEASQFLIVICSPNAARSKYVDEEIRRFKALGRATRVIPVIVDGEPGDPHHECFPPGVRFKVGPDAELTGEREEPLAADARPQGDGKETTKLKVVAGMLGLGLDEIKRRAERARRRRNLFRIGAGGVALLVSGGAVAGWMGAASFSWRLNASEILSLETDAADICVRTSNEAAARNVPEARRIELAVKCVDTLSTELDGLSRDARVSLTFISAFEANIALLRKFQDVGELTPQQTELLKSAATLATRLKQHS